MPLLQSLQVLWLRVFPTQELLDAQVCQECSRRWPHHIRCKTPCPKSRSARCKTEICWLGHASTMIRNWWRWTGCGASDLACCPNHTVQPQHTLFGSLRGASKHVETALELFRGLMASFPPPAAMTEET